MLGAVVRIIGWDPGVGAQVTLRAASHDDAAVCHMDGQVWWPAITKLPVLRYDLFDGAFGGAIVAPSSSMTLAIEPWPNFGRYSLADATFELWAGEVGAPFARWTKRFNGRLTEQPEVADGVASIAFAVDDRWLDEPLLDLYEGTTGAEGDAALKGTPKPLAIGAPRYVPGVLVDGVDNILQLSAYGPIMGVDVALERLNRFAAPVADYPTFAALKAATIAPGAWATCNGQGFVRHGAPLEGQPSYLMRGDRAGSGGWARLPGAVIKRIAEMKGAGNRVSDASLAALDAAAPWPISLWLSEQVTVRDIIQRIAASVNAVAGVSWLGELFVVPVAIGTPTIDLRTDGTALPPTGDLTQIAIAQPFWRIGLQAERTWQVHALSDVAFGAELIERGPYNPVEVYREGAIVTLPDGSRWLYVAATPTAGNAPSEGSAYWSVLTRAVTVPGYFTVGARGNAAQLPGHYLHGLRSADGSPIAVTYDRSYTVCHYNSDTGDWTSRSFDVFGDGEIDYGYGAGEQSNAAAMAYYLNQLVPGTIVVVFTADEPATNRLGMGLPAAMYRCGASATVFGGNGDAFPYRCAYILVGFAGAGQGNAAFERAHPGGIDNSPNAWLLTSFSIVNGVLQLGARDGSDGRDGTDGLPGAPGANGQTERTHYAYANSPDGRLDFDTGQPAGRTYEGSYVDFVEADSQDPARYTWREYKGPPFGMAARGGAVVAGDQVIKRLDWPAQWDSDAYSTVGSRGSAKVSFQLPASGVMAGLNTDPTTDGSYVSIDVAFYRDGDNIFAFESGGNAEAFGAATPNAVYTIEYDGQVATYSINDVPVRQRPVGPGLIYYFDSSLRDPGTRLQAISFGAGSQRPAGLTLLPHPNTPVAITSANSVRAYRAIGTWGSAKAYSKEYFSGGAVAEWARPAGSRHGDTMAGLAQAAGNSTSYDTITFALHQSSQGHTQAFINGIGWGPAGPTVNPDVENRYKVHYDGRRFVRFYVNGVEIAGSAYEWGQQPDPLQFAAALASTNPAITDIAFSQAGQRGQDGSNGAPGAPGANGLTPYAHFAYANSANGQIDFTRNAPEGRAFIGRYTDYNPTDSDNPASYQWSQYKGPANFGLAASGAATVASNAIILTQGGGWGTGGGYSTEGYVGGAQTSFRFPVQAAAMVGLNTDPAANDSYETIDYAFHQSGNGDVVIYENGASVLYIGGFDPNRLCQIVYNGQRVRYLVNGTVVRDIAAAPNLRLFFDAALADFAGSRVADISFSAAGTAGNDGSPGAPGAPGATGPGGPQGPGGAPGAPGSNGQDGYTAQLTAPTFTLPAFANGGLKPGALASATGRFQVTRRDDQPVPAVTYSVAGQDGGTMSIDGNGNYALTSMDDSSAVARATIILRAQVAGVQPWDRAVVISKAPEGTPAYSRSSNGPTSTTSTTYTDGLIVTGPTTPNIGVAISCNLTYRPTAASATLVGKLQYQINGGAWTDIAGSEQTGSTGFPAPNDPGQISLSGFVPSSSIPANATIGVRSLFRRSIGGGQVDGNGTIAMNWRAN